jgi:hypothetical protein
LGYHWLSYTLVGDLNLLSPKAFALDHFSQKDLRDLKSLVQSYTHSFLLPASRFLDRFYQTSQPHPGKILGLVDPPASPSQRIPIIPRHRLPQREHQSHLRWNIKPPYQLTKEHGPQKVKFAIVASSKHLFLGGSVLDSESNMYYIVKLYTLEYNSG